MSIPSAGSVVFCTNGVIIESACFRTRKSPFLLAAFVRIAAFRARDSAVSAEVEFRQGVRLKGSGRVTATTKVRFRVG